MSGVRVWVRPLGTEEWMEMQTVGEIEVRAGDEFILETRGEWSPETIEDGAVLPPEHNYHDFGSGALISEILGTIDGALGERI